MSTTFDVLPNISRIPCFLDILNLSNKRLQKYCHIYKIKILNQIRVELIKYDNNKNIPINNNDLAEWNKDRYACFYIESFPGSIEAQFYHVDNLIREI